MKGGGSWGTREGQLNQGKVVNPVDQTEVGKLLARQHRRQAQLGTIDQIVPGCDIDEQYVSLH